MWIHFICLFFLSLGVHEQMCTAHHIRDCAFFVMIFFRKVNNVEEFLYYL